MTAVRFPKPEVVITQTWTEISLPNLSHRSWFEPSTSLSAKRSATACLSAADAAIAATVADAVPACLRVYFLRQFRDAGQVDNDGAACSNIACWKVFVLTDRTCLSACDFAAAAAAAVTDAHYVKISVQYGNVLRTFSRSSRFLYCRSVEGAVGGHCNCLYRLSKSSTR